MNTSGSPDNSSTDDLDVMPAYRKLENKRRLEGALLTILTLLGCIGIALGTSLAWDVLKANGELRVLGLFAASFIFLLVVVHRLGRIADTIWLEKPNDVRALAKSTKSSGHIDRE